MTVSSTTSKNTYSGTGSQTIFAYTFRILEEEHILVQIKDTNGVITNKTLTTDYTVAGVNSDNGGNVTFVTAPLATDTIILTRNIPIKQEVDYQENDTFPAETHEGALDKLTMVAQQLKEESDRTVKVDAAVTGFDATLPSPEANKIIGFNANGDGLAIQNLASLGTIAVNGSTVNGMVKYTGTNELTVDAGTVYDGTTLTVTGNVLATNSITSDGAITALGSIFVGGEVDGRDIASDGVKLDNIESGADVTDEANVTSALSGATLTAATVANDDKVLIQDTSDSNNLKTVLVSDLGGGGGSGIVNYSYVTKTTTSSTALTIPANSTIPQNTEGLEYMTLAITPTSASNILVIEVYLPVISIGNDDASFTGALFQDASADAIAVATESFDDGNAMSAMSLKYIMTAGTTSSTTFKFRFGSNSGNSYVLTYKGSTRYVGAVQAYMKIIELGV